MEQGQNLDLLLEQLTNGSASDPDAEWKAAIALGDVELPEEKRRAALALLESLTSGRAHALIRAHAAESLGRLGDRTAVPGLISGLRDPYRLVRAYAAGSLAELADPRASEPLLEALQRDEFFGVRAEAAKALAALSRQMGATMSRLVREVLRRQRETELARPEPGVERVLAEIDRALELLG